MSLPVFAVKGRSVTGPLTGILLAFTVLTVMPVDPILAQDTRDKPDRRDSQRIYKTLYDTAMEDSVISVEEERLLLRLQATLGLHEELVEEVLGGTPKSVEPRLDDSGRWRLVIQNMAWGAGLYGWGVPYVLGFEDPKWYVASEMASFATSFYLTWKYTKNMHLPESRAQFQIYGGGLSLRCMKAVVDLLSLEDEGAVGAYMLAVPAGIYFGDRLYQRWQPSIGQAFAIGLQGELGASTLRTLHRQLNSEEYSDDYYTTDKSEEWQRRHLYFELMGYPLGVYLGQKFYRDRRYSLGDAAMLILGRATGFMYGLAVTDMAGFDFGRNEMAWRWITLGGGIGGMVFTDRYIAGYDYTVGQTVLMGLGGIAGALLTSALGIILEIDEPTFYDLTAIGGSVAGFQVVRKIINPIRESQVGASSGPSYRMALTTLPGGPTPTAGLSIQISF